MKQLTEVLERGANPQARSRLLAYRFSRFFARALLTTESSSAG
jgi:hypothetical protein